MRDWWILRFVDQHIHNPYHLVSCVISRLLAEDKFRIWSSKICVQTSNKLVQTRDEISDRYTNIVQSKRIWNLHYIVHIIIILFSRPNKNAALFTSFPELNRNFRVREYLPFSAPRALSFLSPLLAFLLLSFRVTRKRKRK